MGLIGILGLSRERHFVSKSLPALAPCPDSPHKSQSTLVDSNGSRKDETKKEKKKTKKMKFSRRESG